MLCIKYVITTRVLTLMMEYDAHDNVSFSEIIFNLTAIKSSFQSHTINRILHSWSYHMNICVVFQQE